MTESTAHKTHLADKEARTIYNNYKNPAWIYKIFQYFLRYCLIAFFFEFYRPQTLIG